VIFIAEFAERRPLEVALGLGAEIAVEYPFSVLLRDVQLVLVGIEDLDAVLGAFGEGGAMPGIFVAAVGARRRLAGPARHFQFGPPRLQAGIDEPEFDFLHRSHPQNRGEYAEKSWLAKEFPRHWSELPGCGQRRARETKSR